MRRDWGSRVQRGPPVQRRGRAGGKRPDAAVARPELPPPHPPVAAIRNQQVND